MSHALRVFPRTPLPAARCPCGRIPTGCSAGALGPPRGSGSRGAFPGPGQPLGPGSSRASPLLPAARSLPGADLRSPLAADRDSVTGLCSAALPLLQLLESRFRSPTRTVWVLRETPVESSSDQHGVHLPAFTVPDRLFPKHAAEPRMSVEMKSRVPGVSSRPPLCSGRLCPRTANGARVKRRRRRSGFRPTGGCWQLRSGGVKVTVGLWASGGRAPDPRNRYSRVNRVNFLRKS